MMPPPPAASYLAEGWAMISMRSMVVPSVDWSRTSSSLPERLEGRPSIHTATAEPLSLTLPSKSIVTPGALRSRSVPLLPSVETASEMFITSLSSFCSMTGRRAVTTASSSISASGLRARTASRAGTALRSVIKLVYPMKAAISLYSPEGIRSIVKCPAESVVVPLTMVLSGAMRATVANSIGFSVAASMTVPEMLRTFCWRAEAQTAHRSRAVMTAAALIVLYFIVLG